MGKFYFGPEQICVPLTQGKFATLDIADLHLIAGRKWSALRRQDGTLTYAVRCNKMMHSVILGVKGVDHKDGNGFNNRRSNLRPASQKQNIANQVCRSPYGYKGVGTNGYRRWRAEIRVLGKSKHLGYFASAEEAALAYDKANREIQGEFGTYNFPQPGERSAITGEIIPIAGIML